MHISSRTIKNGACTMIAKDNSCNVMEKITLDIENNEKKKYRE
jgi:hypothetical protein